jgi:hypothetical protein
MKTVSQIASEIYQAAKKAATGAWNWKTEWKNAMKAAWAQVINKVKEAVVIMSGLAEKAMETLSVAYTGAGSDKQMQWASSIYNRDVERTVAEYRYAQRRVNDGTMPKLWTDMWEQVLTDSRVIALVSAYATQPCRTTIDYKGYKSRVGTLNLNAWIQKLVREEYTKAGAAA